MARIDIDILIILYKTDPIALGELFASLCAQDAPPPYAVHLWSNADSVDRPALASIIDAYKARGLTISYDGSDANLGFGPAINRLAAKVSAPYIFLLNHDTRLRPSALRILWDHARDDSKAAMWEMRQAPFEHPKAYDPYTLEAEWCSGAAVLIRREAFDHVGGFEPRIFMYGEDVDLSWRLRSAGYVLRYVPNAVVEHDTYKFAGEVKPLQVFGSTLSNLFLRIRFGTWAEVRQGYRMMLREARAPEEFHGRSRRMWWNLVLGIKHFAYFAKSRARWNTPEFRPLINGWDYGLRREGPFIPVQSKWTSADQTPLVSIIVRTHKRPNFLRRALTSIMRQSYPNVEAIIIEDGAPTAKSMVEREFAGRLNYTYHATGTPVGRSEAGNIGLKTAKGEWLGFLDDDDEFFADHVEVLVDAVLANKAAAAYALSWNTVTRVISTDPLELEELRHDTVSRQPFSRVLLWQYNLMPIQSVLFARRLFEEYGGFIVEMDQLEDWNLWTRYAQKDDFVQVMKTTSKYRTPADPAELERRQKLLDQAYPDAVARQKELSLDLNPPQLGELVTAMRANEPNPVHAYLIRTPFEQIIRDKRFHSSISRADAWRAIRSLLLG